MNSLDEQTSTVSVENVVNIPEKSKFELLSVNNTYSNYYNNKRKTRPYITKFEKTKLIGFRIQQISNGANPMVTVKENETNIKNIVLREFHEKKIPLMIRRHLTDGTYEDWRVVDFK